MISEAFANSPNSMTERHSGSIFFPSLENRFIGSIATCRSTSFQIISWDLRNFCSLRDLYSERILSAHLSQSLREIFLFLIPFISVISAPITHARIRLLWFRSDGLRHGMTPHLHRVTGSVHQVIVEFYDFTVLAMVHSPLIEPIFQVRKYLEPSGFHAR